MITIRFGRGTLEPLVPLRAVRPLTSNASPPQLNASLSKLGPRFKLIALIDPWLENAEKRLNAKRETFVRSAYEDTKVYKNFEEFVQNKAPNMVPNAFVIGSPPMFRGTKQAGKDVALQILKHFPGVPLFIEKPVATGPKEELSDVFEVAKSIKKSGAICSIGYRSAIVVCSRWRLRFLL